MHEELKKVHETKPKYFIEHEAYEEAKYAKYDEANKKLTKLVEGLDVKMELYHGEAKNMASEMRTELEKIKVSVAPGVEFIKGAQGTRWMVEFVVKNWLVIMVFMGIVGTFVWIALKGILKQI